MCEREKKKKEEQAYKYKCDVRRRRQHLSKTGDSCLLESIKGYMRVRKVSEKEKKKNKKSTSRTRCGFPKGTQPVHRGS